MLSCFSSVSPVALSAVLIVPVIGVESHAQVKEYKSGKVWPAPKIVLPGATDREPPSDAIVLFDGTDLSAWHGGEAWLVADDVATVRRRSIHTKQSFGSCQLHVEWASPAEVKGNRQGRGNSGIYLMGKYEVQILDSFNNETYPDGQAAAVYKQNPPLVNVCRQPGEWQTFDMIFQAPEFDEQGNVTRRAAVTVLHNGVVVQNHFELPGETFWHKPPEYKPHPAKLPLMIQFHGNPVRFRNIWIRELSS